MRTRPLTPCLITAIALAFAWTQRADTQPVPGLFLDATPPNAFVVSQGPATVRSRLVTIDFGRLRETLPLELGGSALRQTLAFTLFRDISATAELESVESTASGYVWIGRLSNGREGQVTLAVTDNVMAGSIWTGASHFGIRHVDNGVHVIEEVNQAALPPELPPVVPPQGGPATLQPATSSDDGSTIDVLVVYTPSARTAQGGTSAIQAKIDLGITETNLAYADSGAIQRLRLVWKEEVAYTEGPSMSTDLSRLTSTSDGFLDAVHALRDTYGADVVQLIVNSSGACGVAYLMTTQSASFAQWAFGVTHHSCISPNYTFAHEMAHNMGVHHDVYVTGSSTGVYPYSHGYVNQAAFPAGATQKRWRDIMAYNDQCAASGFNCTRLRYFSNPANTYTGDPMGDASTANAAASLNNTRVTVSNFRQSIANPPGAFNKTAPAQNATLVSTTPTLVWGAAAAATGYEYCIDTSNNNACNATWVSAGANLSVTLPSLPAGTAHYWHVRANNGGGTTYSQGNASSFMAFTTEAVPFGQVDTPGRTRPGCKAPLP